MNNNSTALAEKVKGLDAKKIGNALLNNALIIIMLAVAVYVAVTEPSFLAPRSLVNLLSLTAAYLPVAHGQGGHDGLGVHVHFQRVENLLGALGHQALAHHDARHLGVAAKPEVVLHAAGQGLVQLLMHHGHAVFQRLLGAAEVDLLAVQLDGARVLVVDAEQALHQGGLARAVLAHQSVHGARPWVNSADGVDQSSLVASYIA